MQKELRFFFRKPYKDYFSIEELFQSLQQYLPNHWKWSNYVLSYQSRGFWPRLYACFEVIFHQGAINHITGDIHFISVFLRKRKTLLTIHDLAVLNRSSGLKKWVLWVFWFWLPAKRVRFITVISEFTKSELLKQLSIPETMIRVIPNPVSSQFIYSPKEEMGPLVKLFQVSTKWNKNLEVLIQAVVGLNVELIILGHLSEDQNLLLKEANLKYKNYYNAPFAEVIKLYQEADIVCFASLYEGFGMPIIEAQATGRPIITSDRCSMPWVAGGAALLIDPESVAEYRSAIINLIENANLRKSLVKKGLENVKRFNVETVSQQYVKLYDEMLN